MIQPNQKQNECRVSLRKISRIFTISLIYISIILAIFNGTQVKAADLYFDAQEATIGAKGEFKTTINISAKNPINAIAAAILFSPEITPYDVSDGSSIINLWLDKPHWNENTRLLTFSGIIPGGFTGKNAPLVMLKLRISGDREGEGTLSFDREQTKIYLHTPDGIEDTLKLGTLSIPIVIGKENLPVKLHDTDPPEPFTPIITRDASVFNNKRFLVFATQDKGSGLFCYEVAEKRGKLIDNYNKLSWQIAESPYQLYDQELRSYIYVKAVDKAGNQQITFLPPQYPSAEYVNYLKFIVIISILIVVIIAYIIWLKSRRKIKN